MAGLSRIGGVEGALSVHADHVLRSLLPDKRQAARSILIRLVTAQGTRARLTDKELALDSTSRRDALNALIRGRLVVAGESDGASVYEIAHEALISSWGTLRRWLEEEGSSRLVRERLAAAAAEWDRLGRKEEGLWRGRQLGEAAAMDIRELLPTEAAFLAASRGREQRMHLLKRAAPVLAVLLTALVYGGFHFQRAAKVNALLAQAAAQYSLAQEKGRLFEAARTEAFRHFAERTQEARKQGDKRWQEVIALLSEAESGYAQTTRVLELAYQTDPSRSDVRDLFAQVLYERAVLAEKTGREDLREVLVARLEAFDTGPRKSRFLDPRRVLVTTSPPGATRALYRYVKQPGQAFTREPIENLPADGTWNLAPGSYLLVLGASSGAGEVQYPFLIPPAIEHDPRPITLHVDIPSQVPADFVYVGGGAFLFGYGSDESNEFIRAWYQALPQHEHAIDAFFIARYETTYEQWIAFLRDQPPALRDAYLPKAKAGEGQHLARVELIPRNGSDDFDLDIYPKREVEDWRRLPVTGISGDAAEAFMAWLDETGRVPDARFCREDEWEKAARGADGRLFAHGNHLDPRDANIDQTYGRDMSKFGLDMVGSYPNTLSPFGLQDTIGNAREMTVSLFDKDVLALSGGTYFHDWKTSVAPNRDTMLRTGQTLPTVGLRVCADAPGPTRALRMAQHSGL